MPLAIDPHHRFFDSSDDSAESWLMWARRLAVIIGALSVITAPIMIAKHGDGGGPQGFLTFASGLAYLALARHGDAVRATALLCALTVLIALPVSSGPFVIFFAELVVFGFGFRGAVTLSRGTAPTAPEVLTGANIDIADLIDASVASSRARLRPIAEFWAGIQRQEVIDVVAALFTAGLGVRIFHAAVGIDPQGDMIGAGLMLMLIAIMVEILGGLFVIVAIGSYWSKAWAPLLRGTAYLALSVVVLGYAAVRWVLR